MKGVIIIERQIKINGIYQNFLGKKVKVIKVEKDKELESDIVIYRDITEVISNQAFICPLDVFMGEVDKSKYPDCKQKYRYELLETT